MSAFEKWWENYESTRLRYYTDAREKANLCGIAKDAWNEAIKEAAKACEVVAELEGATVVRKLKA